MAIIGVRQLTREGKKYLELVERTREPMLITRHGKPVAALIAVDATDAERYIVAGAPTFLETRRTAERAGPDQPARPLHDVAPIQQPADVRVVREPPPAPPAQKRRRRPSRRFVRDDNETVGSVTDIADYLRSQTGLPTAPVGSLPRPASLQAAYADYDAGILSKEDLEREQDAAVKDSIERQEATGQPINSDGEQRWSSFATYPIADTLAGTGLAPNLGPGGQFFAIFADGHGRQLPKLTGGPLKYNFYAADTLKKSLPYATKPMKQAVIAPSMLALLYPLKDPVEGYSREEFEEDIVQECVTDIRKAFEVGAAMVSIDFTEGRLATREDPRNPWTGAGLLPHFIDLNNRVLANFSDADRRRIGIHTCPGGDRDSVHSADVPYTNLLPEMFKINAGYFLIQLASERDKDAVYQSIGQHSRDDQMCYIGVTVTQSPRPESPQEICDMIVRAADFIPKERLGTTDDCGFSPFSIDEKPNYGSPDYAREIAFHKIANRVEGTKRAAEKLTARKTSRTRVARPVDLSSGL